MVDAAGWLLVLTAIVIVISVWWWWWWWWWLVVCTTISVITTALMSVGCLLTVSYATVEWLLWAHEREHTEHLATGKRWWWLWWWWWLRYWWMGNLFGGVNIFVQLARVTFTIWSRVSSSKGGTGSWGIDFIWSYLTPDELLHRPTSPSHRSSHRYPCVEESVPWWSAWQHSS